MSIPKLDGPCPISGGQHPPIGAESERLHQALEAAKFVNQISRCRIPDLDCPVFACGAQQCPVRVECYAGDPTGMPGRSEPLVATGQVPEADRPGAGRDEQLAAAAECDTHRRSHGIGML